jgi:hypothetical protein
MATEVSNNESSVFLSSVYISDEYELRCLPGYGGNLKKETKPARTGSDGEREANESTIQLPIEL